MRRSRRARKRLSSGSGRVAAAWLARSRASAGRPVLRRLLASQARQVESEGYTSILSAHAMGRGFMMADPFIALSTVAAVTESVEIGTAILQLPLYNPTDIALKSYALAQLSGGRFILGVGAGSTRVDYELHNATFSKRFDAFEENLMQLRQIFESQKSQGIDIKPWDSVKQGVPIFFGTWGKHVSRAATQFDGWIASGLHRSVDEVTGAIKSYRGAGGGRAIVSTIQVAGGQDLGELRERLVRYREAGFDDAVIMFLPGAPSPGQVRQLID